MIYPPGEAGRRLQALHEAWQDSPMETLEVEARLAAPYTSSTPEGRVALDGILAWAVASEYMAEVSDGKAYTVPIPLLAVWSDPRGLPLWAASDLTPVGVQGHSRIYTHRRIEPHTLEWAAKKRLDTVAGRWKDVRTPVALIHARALRAIVVGVRGEILRLLDRVTHVGRRTSLGYGRVLRWRVRPVDYPLAAILMDRPTPTAFLQSHGLPDDPQAYGGWTPPYWYAPWHTVIRRASRD